MKFNARCEWWELNWKEGNRQVYCGRLTLYLFLSSILHSLHINEAGFVVQASQLVHELSFNVGITVDSVVTSIMKSGASTGTAGSIGEFRYNTVMIKFSSYYISWSSRDPRRRHGVDQLNRCCEMGVYFVCSYYFCVTSFSTKFITFSVYTQWLVRLILFVPFQFVWYNIN